jgi:hypothetical protein
VTRSKHEALAAVQSAQRALLQLVESQVSSAVARIESLSAAAAAAVKNQSVAASASKAQTDSFVKEVAAVKALSDVSLLKALPRAERVKDLLSALPLEPDALQFKPFIHVTDNLHALKPQLDALFVVTQDASPPAAAGAGAASAASSAALSSSSSTITPLPPASSQSAAASQPHSALSSSSIL